MNLREEAIQELSMHTYGYKYTFMLKTCDESDIEKRLAEAIKKAYIYESCKYD